MKKDRNESIYHYFLQMMEQSPNVPYIFQDVKRDGLKEARYYFSNKILSLIEREKLAMKLIKKIEACIKDSENLEELQLFLNTNPLILYVSTLNERIKLFLSEGLLNKDELYTFGMNLVTEGKEVEEVQLGMILISFSENDLTKKMLKTFGYHSAFTFYAIEAAKNFTQYNQFFYDLLQHTAGYGKIFALDMFIPLREKEQKYVFDYGAFNEASPNLSSIICMEKPEMESFFENLPMNEDTFSKLSYLLAHAGEANDLKRISHGFVLIDKYISNAKQLAHSFIDLAAITIIKKNMVISMYDDEKKLATGWTFEKINQFHEICTEILSEPKWKFILFQELENPAYQTSLFVEVMNELEVLPDFETLLPLIENDIFHMDLLKFFLIDHPEYYVGEVYHFLLEVLPEKVFNGQPQILKEEEVDPEYIPDIWLEFLLKTFQRQQIYEESFFLKCVTARFSPVRIEALKALRIFKNQWSPEVFPALKEAMEHEPDPKIKKQLSRLINKKHEKEQQYVDISNVDIKPSPWDIPLFKTRIAGTFYRDMLVVEGRLEKGDILYLIREPDNPYDSKAILVTTDDGYVLGYVPKAENKIPSSMLDEGEKLYAILESDHVENGNPIIQIMINKRPKDTGKVIPFPYRDQMNYR